MGLGTFNASIPDPAYITHRLKHPETTGQVQYEEQADASEMSALIYDERNLNASLIYGHALFLKEMINDKFAILATLVSTCFSLIAMTSSIMLSLSGHEARTIAALVLILSMGMFLAMVYDIFPCWMKGRVRFTVDWKEIKLR